MSGTTACVDRADECTSGAAAAEDALFLAIRRCAPVTLSDVCAFAFTLDVGAAGCATDAYAIAHPAGVDASVADSVTSCVAGVISRSRYTCLASKRLRPGCP